MQGSLGPIVGNRREFVGAFRIYVTSQGEFVIPVGNCSVYVEDEQARDFLKDLLSLAEVAGSNQPTLPSMEQVR